MSFQAECCVNKYFPFHLTIKPELNQSIYGLTNTDKSGFKIKDNDNKIKICNRIGGIPVVVVSISKNNVRLYMFFD